MFSGHEKALMASLLLFGVVLDSLTTFVALNVGLSEGNPLLAWWLSVETFWVLILLKFLTFGWLFLAIIRTKKIQAPKNFLRHIKPTHVLGALNGLYVFAVANNLFYLWQVFFNG